MKDAYGYVFYRLYRWYSRREGEEGSVPSAILFLTMLGVCNLWSLIILIDRSGVIVDYLLQYEVRGAILLCVLSVVIHSLLLLQNRRYREIIEMFDAHKIPVTPRHNLIFWVYVIGTIPLMVIIIATHG
jgi:hypothetical protein